MGKAGAASSVVVAIAHPARDIFQPMVLRPPEFNRVGNRRQGFKNRPELNSPQGSKNLRASNNPPHKGTGDLSISPDIPTLPTYIPTISGSAMTRGVRTRTIVSIALLNMDGLRVDSDAVVFSAWAVETENASFSMASTSAWLPTITISATTGFGIAIKSSSMKTRIMMAGTWPTTCASAPTFT